MSPEEVAFRSPILGSFPIVEVPLYQSYLLMYYPSDRGAKILSQFSFLKFSLLHYFYRPTNHPCSVSLTEGLKEKGLCIKYRGFNNGHCKNISPNMFTLLSLHNDLHVDCIYRLKEIMALVLTFKIPNTNPTE